MSAVIAADAAAPAPAKRGRKKLILLIAIALVLVLAIGGGAVFWLKHKAAKAAEAEGEEGSEHAAKFDPRFVPVFLPLDPFVVNLADKETDRFAQIGITLELENTAATDQIKAYMPAVRNAILLLIAGKTSQDLGDRVGKEKLANEILRESVRPLGIRLAEPAPVTVAPQAPSAAEKEGAVVEPAAHDAPAKKAKEPAAEDDEVDADPKAKAKAKAKAASKGKSLLEARKSPVLHVHFSSFIIQ